MKAALTYGPFDTRVVDVPEPTPGAGQVKVRIAYCGICGSDPEIYEGTFGLLKAPWWPPAPFPTEAFGIPLITTDAIGSTETILVNA